MDDAEPQDEDGENNEPQRRRRNNQDRAERFEPQFEPLDRPFEEEEDPMVCSEIDLFCMQEINCTNMNTL